MKTWLLIGLSLLSFVCLGDAETEARFKRLTEQLRCVVCQNQNLADSNAELAIDLKNQIRTQIAAGKTDEAIEAFLVSRYGEFVLYQPKKSGKTLLLWLIPLAILLIIFIIWLLTAKQKVATTTKQDTTRLAAAKAQLNRDN
jgi:cytochrome c-type biogenesis protein CcmH